MCHFYRRSWIAFISYRRTTCLDRHQNLEARAPREQNIDADHSPGVRRGPTSRARPSRSGAPLTHFSN